MIPLWIRARFATGALVRVGVHIVGRPVRGPAGVADANGALVERPLMCASRSLTLPWHLEMVSWSPLQQGHSRHCRSRDTPDASVR
jgi:hypothetical protein